MPDLASRVKLWELKNVLFKKEMFGKINAHLLVINFQRRGLSHAHMVLISYPSYKLRSTDENDNVVCSDIPSINNQPRLFATVSECMVHGPCGIPENKEAFEMAPQSVKNKFPELLL